MARRSRSCSPLRRSSRAAATARSSPSRHAGGRSVAEGTVAMSVSGRPVFVLQGTQPSHRDIGPGSRGPDVRPARAARLHGWGFRRAASTIATTARPQPRSPPGTRARAGRRSGRPTSSSKRCARPTRPPRRRATCTFRPSSRSGARHTGSRRARSRRRASTSRRPATASTPQRSASARRGSGSGDARGVARRTTAIALAVQNARRDNQLAAADVALKRATLNKAIDAHTEAQRTLAEAPPDTSPAERAALQAAVRQASDDVDRGTARPGRRGHVRRGDARCGSR